MVLFHRKDTNSVTGPIQGVHLIRERLLAYLAQQAPLLLVLDNTEQITDVSLLVRDILAAAPDVSCLVTSRRPLRLDGETVVGIQPLPTQEAHQLFEVCARMRCNTFTITASNHEDIAELCRRLDGLPLAIELAAARCMGLTPRQMLERLSERFRLLNANSQARAPRQRALWGALEWSHDLLTNEERSLLAELSVFAGGFSLEDAEAVCEASDVFEGVLALRDHSLLSSEVDMQTQATRFYFLESVHDYAREKRYSSSESENHGNSIGERHARYFASRAKEVLRAYRTTDEASALRSLIRENANLETAMDWARNNADPTLFAFFTLVIGSMLQRRGFAHDALAPINAGLAALAPDNLEHTELRARLLRELAGLHLDANDGVAAQEAVH